jgi:uncharacterized membrane protein YfcA
VGVAEAFAIFVAGVGAGTVNAVVGSGSLITFPTLLAFGFMPVIANVSNNVGLVPGNFSGAWGYRRELAGQRGRLAWLGIFSALGAAAGAAALLALPPGAFKLVVPALILVSCLLVLVQPRLSARIAARRQRSARAGRGDVSERGGPVLAGGIFGAAVYGGYFGAAQGVLVIGLLGTFLDESMQRVNAGKNVLVGIVNGSAAIVYILFAHVNWAAAALIAAGSTIGGLLGARIGRRLPPVALRIFIVVIGVVSAVRLIFF